MRFATRPSTRSPLGPPPEANKSSFGERPSPLPSSAKKENLLRGPPERRFHQRPDADHRSDDLRVSGEEVRYERVRRVWVRDGLIVSSQRVTRPGQPIPS